MDLIAQLGGGPIAIDTAPFIYWIEDHPTMVPVIEPVFEAIDRGDLVACTSDSELTLLEVLVVPYRSGNQELVAAYEDLLGGSRGIEMVPIDAEILRLAAQLRATTSLRSPDAIQVASAVRRGCTAFVTCDRRIPDLGSTKVVTLGV